MEKIKKLLNNKNLLKTILLSSLFLLVLQILFKSNNIPTSFSDRTMGQSLMNNIDVSKRIKFYYLTYCVFFPFLLYFLYLYWKKNINNMEKKVKNILNALICLDIINYILFIIIYQFSKQQIHLWISITILNIIIFIILILHRLKNINFDIEKLQWSCISSFPGTLISLLFLNKLGGGVF